MQASEREGGAGGFGLALGGERQAEQDVMVRGAWLRAERRCQECDRTWMIACVVSQGGLSVQRVGVNARQDGV